MENILVILFKGEYMPALPSGLETHTYGTDGWHATYNANFELLDEKIGGLVSYTKEEITDLAEETYDAAGDNYTATEKGILNDLVTDVPLLQEKVNEILVYLRALGIVVTPGP